MPKVKRNQNIRKRKIVIEQETEIQEPIKTNKQKGEYLEYETYAKFEEQNISVYMTKAWTQTNDNPPQYKCIGDGGIDLFGNYFCNILFFLRFELL